MRRRVVDKRTYLLLLDDVWYRVEIDVLPKEHLVECRRQQAAQACDCGTAV